MLLQEGLGVRIEGDGTYSRLTVGGSSAVNSGTYRIVAKNDIGEDSAEFKVIVKGKLSFVGPSKVSHRDLNNVNCIVDRPSAPRNVRVTAVSPNSVTLTWDEPEQDGGSPITGYIVEKAESSRRSYINAGTCDTLTFTVEKLYEGTEYLFRVSAENAIGTSEPTGLAEPVTAKHPFGMISFLTNLVMHVS